MRASRSFGLAGLAVTLCCASCGPPEVPVLEVPSAAVVGPSFDEPDLAADYARTKRLSRDRSFDSRRAYEIAEAARREMPLHSTALDRETSGPGATEAWASEAKARWEPLGPGNIGGRTRALLVDPVTPDLLIAAGVSGGIWRSLDGGGSWVAVGDGLSNIAVSVLARDPRNRRLLWAGTGEGHFREVVRGTSLPLRGGGIFRSQDIGRRWSRVAGAKGADFLWVNDLIVSPCLLYTSPSPRDRTRSRMPSSA